MFRIDDEYKLVMKLVMYYMIGLLSVNACLSKTKHENGSINSSVEVVAFRTRQ